MPICPRCNSSIHTGAEEQCPACGYGMERADAMFGDQDIEFTRVVDEAGALTHRERVELLGFLADLERNIPPVALCIYITDHGQLREFRTHAHWALNHARIHHPSFGRREQMSAIEDAELRERRPGEGRPAQEAEPGPLASAWKKFRAFWRDMWVPYPPPARQDWILMLVVDVQLEVACFSWGYMLDPYVGAEKIISTIAEGQLQFRERSMVQALKRVMKFAVRHVAKKSREVNRVLRRRSYNRHVVPAVLAAAGVSAGLLAAPHAVAQEPAPADAPAPAPAEASAAPAEAPAAPADTPAATPPPPAAEPTPPPVVPGVAAAYNAEPRWSSADYVNLMSGRLTGCYNMLMPGGKQRAAAPQTEVATEADKTVAGSYCEQYMNPRATALRDPQQLLSDVERDDIAHVLRELNAHSRFHIYVSVFEATQEVPRDLAAANLVTHVAHSGQYTVLLQYGLGEPTAIEIGYKEVAPTDEQVREWLEKVRQSVNTAGGGAAGLLAAVRTLHAVILPVSDAFTPLTPETAGTVPAIELPLKPEEEVKEVSEWDERKEWLKSAGAVPYFVLLITLLAIVLIIWRLWHWRRGCGRLFSSEPDYRLSSRYGAGVSRYVRYMHGKVADKEKSSL